jgi:hypothetical protein
MAHLKSRFSAQAAALGDERELTAFVRRTIRKAAGYGIDNKGSVTTLAELMIQFGDDFERSPLQAWTMNILSQRTVPGQVRTEALRERYEELTGGRPVLVY